MSSRTSFNGALDAVAADRAAQEGAFSARALIVHPELPRERTEDRDAAARLAEAVGLALAIDLEVVGSEVIRINRPQAGMLFGRGVVARVGDVVRAEGIGLVVVNTDLSPVQQRNLEHAWQCKVIDRTGLILEIFGARAQTREGKLQVELAALEYQRSRLVRSWTHLERQRGGYGFMGGPGERQLEMDRRLLTERITRLKRDLGQVRRTRELHRKQRRRVPYAVIALVGYTNAGKSTLFNRLARAQAFEHDMLFATLDPAMRRLRLPGGQAAILSDTVGFISELPTQLVAAFRATLEEVLEADLVVHVRDITHPQSDAQRRDVEAVLNELGLGESVDAGLLEVFNKIDLLGADERASLVRQTARDERRAACSAATGEGCEDVLARIEARLARDSRAVELSVRLDDGAAIAWLYDRGQVLRRRDDERYAHLTVTLEPADEARFHSRHGEAVAPGL